MTIRLCVTSEGPLYMQLRKEIVKGSGRGIKMGGSLPEKFPMHYNFACEIDR